MVPLQLLVASALAWGGEPQGEILDFTAKWCGPCQQVSPVVSKLQRDGMPIRKVDVDEEPELKSKYKIKTIPTFVLLIDGNEVARAASFSASYPPEAGLRRLCAMLPQASAEPKSTEPKSTTRQSARVKANEVDLGSEAPLPRTAAVPAEPQKQPGMIARIFGGKKKEVPATAPGEARAQGEEALAGSGKVPESTPLSATVRLRVIEPGGDVSLGTGTIIDSRPGQALVLTCGHIFRRWGKGGQVEVALYEGNKPKTIIGKLVAYELDERAGADMGLVSIPTDDLLPVCRVASSAAGILPGAPVRSVGCGGGEPPTVQPQKITALNRYKTNDIECSVMPVEGRSGGGLFDRQNRLIGVCMVADPKYREGAYAGLKAIHAFLDRQRLTRVYRGEGAEGEETQLAAAVPDADASSAELGEPETPRNDRKVKEPAIVNAALTAEGRSSPADLSPEDVVGSEVVIIIRANGQPGAPSKVVRLHRAGRGFWDDLVPELDSRDTLQETALKTAHRQPAQRPERRQVRKPTTVDRQLNPARFASADASADEPKPFRRQRSAESDAATGVAD